MNLGKSQTNLGIMQYGRTGDVMPVASLGKHTLRGDVINAISMMKLKNDGYNSDLAYALKMASKKVRLVLAECVRLYKIV